MKIYGGIEAGGTKQVCMVAENPQHVLAEIRFPTTKPQETIQKAVDFFLPFVRSGDMAAIGIGSFGPIDLDPYSSTYGYITSTPKPGWEFFDFRHTVESALGVPVAMDTDVNAAALGEYFWVKENHGLDPIAYMTIGTGIGVGALVNGGPIHGLVHIEAGHSFVPHDWREDPYQGHCPFHGDCLDGLASGPAITSRWGIPAEQIPADHPAWKLEAGYIALALANLILFLSPRKIILGGGVMQQKGLFPRIRKKTVEILHGYIQADSILREIDRYIVPPSLGNRSGVLGAIALAVKIMG